MRPFGKRAVSLLVVAVAALCGPTRAREARTPTAESILASQPPELVERLFENQSVLLQEVGERDRMGGSFFLAFVIFQQPRSQVLRLLTQTSRHIEFRPEVEGIETIEWYEHGNLDEHRLKIMFMSIVYRLHNRWDVEAGRVSWQLDPDFDNDLRRVQGFWELYELDDDRTLARFGTIVDVGGALPGFLQDFVTRKNLPAAIERCRRWVDSNGRYRP